ncbi:hypothetical protein AMTR_s00122p00121250 [Amborella trichopoda]|uniref:ABC transporter family G domain-containing protein n=1 Tax=Amborella trichopoda TaxID=13333 RepID=W1NN74_AMBTC|nr:hypothetical protein AMTR_s00122p00121250 [Amborella trichopoda]
MDNSDLYKVGSFIGEMTVRETLAFSARCQGVGARYDLWTELSRREKEANIKPDPDLNIFMKVRMIYMIITESLIIILTGEMVVGPSRSLFMDEISTGLDSSTTYRIVNSIRQTVHILKKPSVISLLQPAPETYDLFDDIILLSDGQIVYQGLKNTYWNFLKT